MRYSSSLRLMTRILWICAVAISVTAEMLTIVAFRKIPSDHSFFGLGTKYVIFLIVPLPMVAGINGYYSVRRRLSSAADDVISALSMQFLITIIMAYAALMVCVASLS